MKMAKRVISMALVLVLAMSLMACGASGIVGSWEETNDGVTVTYTFEKDGSMKMKTSLLGLELSGTYKTEGDKLIMTVSILGMEDTQEYTYKLDGNKLTMSGVDEDGLEESYTLTRK